MFRNHQRRPRFPSVHDFIQMFQLHNWSFLQAKRKMNPEEIQGFVKALEKEQDVFGVAWHGGDEYMQVLANHIVGSMERYAARSELEKMTMILARSYGDEFLDYLQRLQRHDWYFRESDVASISRAGQVVEDELKAIANQKGGVWLDAFKARAAENYKPIKKSA